MKADKKSLKKIVGRKLAARVLRTWTEDFVDEDTGEVVSIDRNEVLFERDSEIGEEDIDTILEAGPKSIILHRENVNIADFAIIYNTLGKDNSNSEKEAVEQIYRQLRNTEAPRRGNCPRHHPEAVLLGQALRPRGSGPLPHQQEAGHRDGPGVARTDQ